MGNKRQTNFEMIRILAMVLIIIHHIFVHSIEPQLSQSDIFEGYEVYDRLMIVDFARSFGKIGNILFVMLSGYFLIDKKIDMAKHTVKILSEMFFATVVLMLAGAVHLYFQPVYNVLNLRAFNEDWWFPGYYIVIIFAAWIGLNRYLVDAGRDKFRILLIVLFAAISIAWIRNAMSAIGLTTIAMGIFSYMLGGYIKLYDPLKKLKGIWLFVLIICSLILMGVSYHIYASANMNAAIATEQPFYNRDIEGYLECSLPCIVISLSLFEAFKRIKCTPSALVNSISSSTFMIYLLHDNRYARDRFYMFDWLSMIRDENYIGLISGILIILIVIFAIGILMSKLCNITMKGIRDKILNL